MNNGQLPVDVHQQAVELIDSGRSLAMAVILRADGSTPQKAGVKAILDDRGRIWGTLGGGFIEACIHGPAAYVGMIGSRRKVALIREDFVRSGLSTEEQFDRVFAPIGLDIGALTVPEIATSIAAELIAVRRGAVNRASAGSMVQR